MDAVASQPAPNRRVTLRACAAFQGGIELAVEDSGAGIDPALLTKVFDPFFTTKSTGMGMGLSVSRTIVDAHQGRLWAENGPHGGATFRVVLPAATPAVDAVESRAESAARAVDTRARA
jgi:signal transduction histidine kinase